jgi:Uma2 family endonuclease
MATVPRATRRPLPRAQAGVLAIISDRGTLTVPPSAYSMEGFRDWATADDFPEKVKVTFLDGEVTIDMSNEEINAHVLVKGEIVRVLTTLVRELRLGRFFPDGMLLTNTEAGVSNNPDAVFVSRDAFESNRVKLVPRKGAEHLFRELEGTPDLVVEIVSDSSVQKDTVRLREAYHKAGIPEFWLIDGRGVDLSFQVLLHRKSSYAAAPSRDGWQRSRVFGRSFRLSRTLDDFGLWEYTLETRD